jgi:hypothetical protein
MVRTKEGRSILSKRELVTNCLKSFHKDRSDATTFSICECQVNKMDLHFTSKQYKRHTAYGIIDIGSLIKEDSLFEKEMENCFKSSGQTFLLQAEGFEDEFIANCINGIQQSTEKKLDINNVRRFCSCQLDLVKAKKISDAEIETLSNPNSLLFYEMMDKCGDPFLTDKKVSENWNQNSEHDIEGPSSDTINILTINGMSYVKIKTGSLIQIWLFDTGSSDLLINTDMEKQLKKEDILQDSSYLGIGEYEMANGTIDSCRKYKISNVQIGKFKVNNIVVAVTEKGKKIIVGKGLLNKFSNWSLNNKENTLILTK